MQLKFYQFISRKGASKIFKNKAINDINDAISSINEFNKEQLEKNKTTDKAITAVIEDQVKQLKITTYLEKRTQKLQDLLNATRGQFTDYKHDIDKKVACAEFFYNESQKKYTADSGIISQLTKDLVELKKMIQHQSKNIQDDLNFKVNKKLKTYFDMVDELKTEIVVIIETVARGNAEMTNDLNILKGEARNQQFELDLYRGNKSNYDNLVREIAELKDGASRDRSLMASNYNFLQSEILGIQEQQKTFVSIEEFKNENLKKAAEYFFQETDEYIARTSGGTQFGAAQITEFDNVKKCSCCGAVKPLSEFYKRGGKQKGLRAVCKVCENKQRWERKNRVDVYEFEVYDREGIYYDLKFTYTQLIKLQSQINKLLGIKNELS